MFGGSKLMALSLPCLRGGAASVKSESLRTRWRDFQHFLQSRDGRFIDTTSPLGIGCHDARALVEMPQADPMSHFVDENR